MIREAFNVFADEETRTDVTSLQFYGFQVLGSEKDSLTFECDVFMCGDVSGGPCGEVLDSPRVCVCACVCVSVCVCACACVCVCVCV